MRNYQKWLSRLTQKEPARAKRVRDIGGGKPETIMLRERRLHVEFDLSRKNVEKFLVDHKIGTGVAVAVLTVALVTRFALVGFASTVDFYPASCLGSWDNVQNVLGKPDLFPGASPSAFTAVNSASFSTTTAQMFCGNFSGETKISDLKGKNFERADLILSWTVIFPEAPQANGEGGGGAGVENNANTASGTSVASGTAVATTTIEPSPTSPTPAAPSAGTPTASPEPSPAPVTTEPVVSPTPEPTPAVTPEAAPVSAPAPAPMPEPTQTPAPDSAPTTWLSHFLPIAFAQATAPASSSSIPEVATTTPPAVATSVEGTPTRPVPAPILINTSVFQNIVLPASSADDFLGIVYSTDGATWQPLATVNKENWRTTRYPIPIHSWDELDNLQIAFVGLGVGSVPKVFVDSAGIQVNYVDTPQATTEVTPEEPQPEAEQPQAEAPEAPTIPAEDILQKSTAPENDVFEQGAHQQCVIAPFSQVVAPGTTANFSLQLFSGLTTPSTVQKPGTATTTLPQGFQHPVYEARLGSLPVGVSSVIRDEETSDVSSTKNIKLRVGSGAGKGSFSLLVIYRERQDDASMRSTACQLNLVVR